MNLAAVLVHFGSSDYTAATLARLEKSQAVQKIIAVLHDVFPHEKHFKRTIFLKSENKGYAAGVNRALRQIENEYRDISHVLVLNPDVDISTVQIKNLMTEHVRARSDCTFPSLKEGKKEIHGYDLNFFGLLRPSTYGAKLFPGTCFLTSITAWRKAGEMNETYFHYFEDIDFCIRLRKAGLKLHHAPAVVLKHAGKSGVAYPETELPRYAVRNHLFFLAQTGKLNPISYLTVIAAHFMYLFRWKQGWKGINAWMKGIQEYKSL
jgi:GT2 family glycosyltransferase